MLVFQNISNEFEISTIVFPHSTWSTTYRQVEEKVNATGSRRVQIPIAVQDSQIE